jgi:hypothetical protein
MKAKETITQTLRITFPFEKKVQRQPLSGAGTYTGQLPQLSNEKLKGFGNHKN